MTQNADPKLIQERLEYLRGEIRAERISYGELAELQDLIHHIDADDGELLSWVQGAELALDWENVVGSPNGNYLQAEYKGMHCEVFFNNRLGTAPMAWDWSFYDVKSADPELAVARSDTGFPTQQSAEDDLISYIDGYVP